MFFEPCLGCCGSKPEERIDKLFSPPVEGGGASVIYPPDREGTSIL